MKRKNKGLQGMSYDQILIDQAQKSVSEPVYCRFCGKDVTVPSNNSPGGSLGGWRQHLDWETENKAHVKCAQKAVRESQERMMRMKRQ